MIRVKIEPESSSSSDEESRTETHQEQSTASILPGQHNESQSVPQTSRPSTALHISVHRADILSTKVEEGNDELSSLDVEVYDQQTYEASVFEQVNKAISSVNTHSVDKNSNATDSVQPQQPSNIDDLMRLIHDDQNGDEGDLCDPSDRDEKLLQLTRSERFNGPKRIKTERIDDEPNLDRNIRSMPKIPRLGGQSTSRSIKTEPGLPTTSVNAASTSRISRQTELQRIKVEPGNSIDETTSSSDRSNLDEYKPDDERDETSDDENIDYETDSDLGPDAGDDEHEHSRRKSHKRLQDDGDFRCYQARIKALTKERAKIRFDNILEDGTELKRLDELVPVEGDLQIPKEMWDNLFEHQRTGVRWFWELHQLGTGGILGDEMGLGKTIQMIAFLTALKNSDLPHRHSSYQKLGPTVLVCPATVMHQWLLEFRKWWPQFRVAILHNTGTFTGDRLQLIQVINKSNGVLIVSYQGVVIYQDLLHNFDWHYAILDEGHKIRNPDAQVTLACKRFRTPHRIILSGSPVQNNLKELWSIFDFIYPGKLGTLPVFMEQFATPITQGGYANASDIQVQIAYKCTCVLRDTIKPFLLRRTKAEVNNKLKLPERSEQVLFCKLTDKQRKLYQAYLDSPTVRDIKSGFCQIFVGLIQLRKICNHPDLFDSTECKNHIKQSSWKHPEFSSEGETFGHYKKSGKMAVVEALLKLWKKQDHKVLLFTQSRQMLKIFSIFLNERNYKHLTMDGSTPIGIRQTMVEQFNKDNEIFIFLLTTRVGGVGVNLTGANRIIIYDPDWNPSTDIQARERAWRIGQHRHVIIYRLLTTGTIEEKIYHRQVFKLYLTNRVLRDAKQKRFFKTNDLHELFTLSGNDQNIETNSLFDDKLQINHETIKRSKLRKKEKKRRKKEERDEANQILTEEKIQEMRETAKRLSKMIAIQFGSKSNDLDKSDGSSIKIKTEPGIGSTEVDTGVLELGGVSVRRHSEATVNGSGQSDRASTAVMQPTEGHRVSNSEKKKKDKKHISKKRVKYLDKQEDYCPDDPDTKREASSKRDTKEDYILEHLFKNSNIFSALKHDKIETDSNADYKIVESEAEKVARDAIRALRESRRFCLDSRSGVPNWTGRNGQVAVRSRLEPKNRTSRQHLMPKEGPSSSNSDSLMSSIRKRNQSNPVALARRVFGASRDDSDDEEEEANEDFRGRAKEAGAEGMADKIRQFILYESASDGKAETNELIAFFGRNFDASMTAVFKAILRKMCEFKRLGDKGFWSIKSDLRGV